MNIKDFDSQSFAPLEKYLIIAFTLTVATIWIVIAFQSEDKKIFERLAWPIFLPMRKIGLLKKKKKRQDNYDVV
jgi:hypothetical protein